MKRRVQRHAVTQPSNPSYKFIPLTQGQNAIVDAADYDFLMQWNWQAKWSKITETFYASSKYSKMHRILLNCQSKEVADHINHDTLDNRRSNLRKCTYSQNAANQGWRSSSSGFKGVHYRKDTGRYYVKIVCQGKRITIGFFADPVEGAKVYDRKAKELFGEFACLNFPPSTTG